MRTGPFSDPAVVAVVNRYFIPLHLDNTDGSARRYGMEPGHENAYIILETPEDGSELEKETLILGKLSQVLDPPAAREGMRKFLARHPAYRKPWPELEALSGKSDETSREKRAELLLDEGRAEEALELAPPVSLLRARALRMIGKHEEAEDLLDSLPVAPEVVMERARLAIARGRREEAAARLDALLSPRPSHAEAAEAYFERGWLFHLEGNDDLALETWTEGIRLFPPAASLFSQKARLTMIRENWELPANVDQEK